MTVVWKYTMETPRTVFSTPPGATVLSVGKQNVQIVLWAEVDPSAAPEFDWELRAFAAVNTGMPLPPDRKAFVGTVNDEIVWHVYEVEA